MSLFWTVSTRLRLRPTHGSHGVPIAVLCDNSEDLERAPSDLSDFSLYGGLYRHVHLAYVPGVSLESVHILPTWTPGADAKVSVKARLYNPQKYSGNAKILVEISDAGMAGPSPTWRKRLLPG